MIEATEKCRGFFSVNQMTQTKGIYLFCITSASWHVNFILPPSPHVTVSGNVGWRRVYLATLGSWSMVAAIPPALFSGQASLWGCALCVHTGPHAWQAWCLVSAQLITVLKFLF